MIGVQNKMKWIFLQFLKMIAKIFRWFFSIVGGAGLLIGLLCLVISLAFNFGGTEGIETAKACLATGAFSVLMFWIFQRVEMWADTKIKMEFAGETVGHGCLIGIVILLLFLGVIVWLAFTPRMVQPTVSNDVEPTGAVPSPEQTPQDALLYSESGFIFPTSDTELIDQRSIENLSDSDLMYAINEIYARHGYIFQNQQLREYYEQFVWYCGEIPSAEFTVECFGQIEADNWSLLINERDKRRTSD